MREAMENKTRGAVEIINIVRTGGMDYEIDLDGFEGGEVVRKSDYDRCQEIAEQERAARLKWIEVVDQWKEKYDALSRATEALREALRYSAIQRHKVGAYHPGSFDYCTKADCVDARAALKPAATPDEEREADGG